MSSPALPAGVAIETSANRQLKLFANEPLMITRVHEIARMARRVFEVTLNLSIGTPNTTGTCLYGSILCRTAIERFAGVPATIRGGDGEGDGGVFSEGRWHGHYWVEVDIEDQVLVVDITGDQFGLPACVIGVATDLPAIYSAGHQLLVDGHVSALEYAISAGQST